MKTLSRCLLASALGFVFAAASFADTLELKDGRVLQGRYLGGTQAVLRFEVNGNVQTFSTNDIVAVTFTRGSSQSAPPPAPAPQPAPDNSAAPPPPSASNVPAEQNPQVTSTDQMPGAKPAAPSAASAPPPSQSSDGTITIPAGQPLLVRMIDTVDSAKNKVGDLFHASLETDLNINGAVVARKGADVYGRLAQAKEAGKLSGSSELQLELTRIVIDGRDYPLVSSDYNVQGKGRGSDTAKKVGGGAVVGAIIGAIAGGGKGAAIGAGVGSAAGAGVQIATRGQQVKVPSETLLEFRLQQSATVTPTSR